MSKTKTRMKKQSKTKKAEVLYNIKLSLPADLDDDRVGSLSMCLEDRALATSMMRASNNHKGPWTITWLVAQKPLDNDLAALAAVTKTKKDQWRIEQIPDTDWLARSYHGFQPFSVGCFFIHGSHYEATVPADKLALKIDAATAFGSGEHGTTKGCLLALFDLRCRNYEFANILDMGTGSGILAIAAAMMWPKAAVTGADIDPESVRVAAHYAAENSVKAHFIPGDGFTARDVKARAPYDLIIANILAGPLKEMAASLCAALAPFGKAVLSGLLPEQAEEVVAAYKKCGLRPVDVAVHDGWASIVMEKPA